MKSVIGFFHHLFIPHEKNNYKSGVLQTDFLTYYLILALFFTFFIKKTNLTNVLGFATDITVEKLYQLTNQQRQNNNLPQLNYNQTLSEAARLKAEDMFKKNYWAHYGPDGSSPWNFILQSGYRYEYAGENLAKNFMFSDGVVSAWMNSPTHRENILKNEYTDVGFAVVNGILNGEETTLVVQMFGKPLLAQKPSETKEANQSQSPLEDKKIAVKKSLPITNKQQLNQQFMTKTVNSQPQVLSNNQYFFVNLNYVFLIFLLTALILDLYFSVKLKIIRISGKNLAHLIFVGFLIISLTIIVRGSIL